MVVGEAVCYPKSFQSQSALGFRQDVRRLFTNYHGAVAVSSCEIFNRASSSVQVVAIWVELEKYYETIVGIKTKRKSPRTNSEVSLQKPEVLQRWKDGAMFEPRSSRKPILFFTNSEHGQANIVLAVAYEFLLRKEFEVHIASYHALAQRIEDLNERFWLGKRKENGHPGSELQPEAGEEKQTPDGSNIVPTATFHTIMAMSMSDVVGDRKGSFPHPPGVSAAVKSYKTLMEVFFGFERAEYMVGVNRSADIIKNVDPVAIISDSSMLWSIDAANFLGKECSILNPLTFKDIIAAEDGNYVEISPIIFRIPVSVALENGLPGQLPSAEPYKAGRLHFCPSLPELDFPLSHLPDNVIGCGPIVLPTAPVSESDPELARWLENGPPVVLINLGSHIVSDPAAAALEIAKGLRIVLDLFPSARFLWKLKHNWTKSDPFYKILEKEIESGQIRVPDWLIPDPVSILDSGKIICSVNHGGANTFYEGCRAGIPQVVLPVWWDTYEFAARAEWIGIGVYGNRDCAPGVEASEFSKALIRGLGDYKMLVRAKEIGTLCRKVEGREFACERLSDWARGLSKE